MIGTVLSLCDHTGNMVKPWADAGYECWCLDMQHEGGYHTQGRITWIGADVLRWTLPMPKKYAIAFAFSPCTDLASSGARWFKAKGLRRLGAAIDLVGACAEILENSGAPWMLENPIGSLSTYWRKPDAQFDPCDYGGYLSPEGDAYTKRTCLWTGGGFVVPIPKPVFPIEGSRMHLMPPSDDRANLRSETPRGFAQAVFEANHKRVQAAA